MKKTKWFAALAAIELALFFAGCAGDTEYVESIMKKTYAAPVTFTSESAEDDGSVKVVVKMSSATKDAKIYYTVDGIEPKVGGETTEEYKSGEPPAFTADTTVKAIAVKDGMENSPVSAAFVSITEKTIIETKTYALPVTFTAKDAGTDGVEVTMESATADAEIYYTTDGSEPTAESIHYEKTVTFDKNTTVKAVAVKNGLENSPVSSAFVSITEKTVVETKEYALPVTFTVKSAGTGGIEVTMASATEGAAIYYTTDGSEPTAKSIPYNKDEPPAFKEETTVKAVAVKDGIENSPVSAIYISLSGALLDINNPGTISLSNTANGIMVSVTVPATEIPVGRIIIYRAEYGTDNFTIIGSYNRNSNRRIDGTVNFTDYYIEPGMAYDYKVLYYSALSSYLDAMEISETDTLYAKSGLGLLRYKEKPVLDFDSSAFDFACKSDVSFDNFHDKNPTRTDIEFSLGKKEVSGTVSTRSLLTLCEQLRNNETVKNRQHYFYDLEAVSEELIPNSARTLISIKNNDDWYKYYSLPVNFSYGNGFSGETFTFADELPFIIKDIEDAEGGVEFCADLEKVNKDKKVYRVDFKTSTEVRNYDATSWRIYFSDSGRTNPIPFNKINYVNKYVNSGELYKFNFEAKQKINTSIEPMLSITVCHVPKGGKGELNFDDDLKIEYDGTTGNSELSAKKGKLLKNENGDADIPKSIELSLDGEQALFEINGSEQFIQNITDSDHSNDIAVYFDLSDSNEDVMYFTNFICQLTNRVGSALFGKTLYPYRSRIFSKYYSDLVDGVKYRIDSYTADNQICYIGGLDEPLVVTDMISNKKLTVKNWEDLEHKEKEITLDNCKYLRNKNYIELTALREDGTTCTGRLNLNDRYIELGSSQYDYEISGNEITLIEQIDDAPILPY